MLVVLHQDWEDVLLWILAAVMLGSGLLVVTMRDIIRCGLAMIVCFLALAGIYMLMGVPLLGAAQVIVYIGAISVLILFAIMLTQTRTRRRRLVFQTQAGPGVDRARSSSRSSSRSPSAPPTGARSRARARLGTTTCRGSCSSSSCSRSRSSACCCSPRSSAACSWPSASRAGRRERQPRHVPDPVRDPLRDRLVRVPRAAQRDQHAHVDRADAQRRQPRDRGVRRCSGRGPTRPPRARSSR